MASWMSSSTRRPPSPPTHLVDRTTHFSVFVSPSLSPPPPPASSAAAKRKANPADHAHRPPPLPYPGVTPSRASRRRSLSRRLEEHNVLFRDFYCFFGMFFVRFPVDACFNSKVEDYYKVLEVDYDSSNDSIKLSYRKLALKWHPDKHKGEDDVTTKFQEINEAYKVLSDPVVRLEYAFSGCYEVNRYTARENLTRFKGMILTCNGLGIDHSSKWARHLREWDPH